MKPPQPHKVRPHTAAELRKKIGATKEQRTKAKEVTDRILQGRILSIDVEPDKITVVLDSEEHAKALERLIKADVRLCKAAVKYANAFANRGRYLVMLNDPVGKAMDAMDRAALAYARALKKWDGE